MSAIVTNHTVRQNSFFFSPHESESLFSIFFGLVNINSLSKLSYYVPILLGKNGIKHGKNDDRALTCCYSLIDACW